MKDEVFDTIKRLDMNIIQKKLKSKLGQLFQQALDDSKSIETDSENEE